MSKNKLTKKTKTAYIFWSIISLLLNVVPVMVCAIIVSVNSSSKERTGLIMTIVGAVFISLLNLIFKQRYRSAKWLVLFGLYYALISIPETFIVMLLAIGVGVMVDDFIAYPLKQHYKFRYNSNKEIDRRLGDE